MKVALADRGPATGPAADLTPAATGQPPTTFAPVPVPGLVGGPTDTDRLGGAPVPTATASVLSRRRGHGAMLPAGLAHRMSAGFGRPLDDVRVHADAESDSLARQLQSVAFTHGSDIYFSRGSYAPSTGRGQRLLAHELAHVAQNSMTSGGGGGLTVGRAADPAEAQADAMADTVVRSLRQSGGEGLRRSNLSSFAATSRSGT